jgi:4'-phosphopantetheinyl transferase
MITCCYTEIKHEWGQQELTERLGLLPEKLQQQALRKRQWIDRQLAIAGKLLLLKLLRDRNSQYVLDDLEYNQYRRPYFDGGPDFNIAHSGNIVICGITDQGQIGVDIEQINKLDFNDFTDFFTKNEWHYINSHPDKFDGFYNFWTKKEAVLKTIGSGFHTPLDAVDVSGENLVYDDITYHIKTLVIHPDYKCHIATTLIPQNIQPQKVNF